MEQHPIITAVQESFGVNASLRTRRREVVDARSAIMVALREVHTLHEIAAFFKFATREDGTLKMKSMSHCTVLHAVQQHKHRYHKSVNERKYLYHNYCEIYDFCISYLDNPQFKPVSMTQLRESLFREQMHRKDLEQQLDNYKRDAQQKVKSLEQYIKKMDRQYAKLKQEKESIARAFKQLYNEKKARNEQMV